MATAEIKTLGKIAKVMEPLSLAERAAVLDFVAPADGTVNKAGAECAAKVAKLLDAMPPGPQRATIGFFKDQLAE